MLKRFSSLYLLAISAILILTACQSDKVEEQGGAQHPDGKALVTLRIATDNGKASTRAWQDGNAKTDRTEMMYSWIVLITDGSTIKYKYTGSPDVAKAEIDDVCTNVEMISGNYIVYSFANISEELLKTILNVTSLEPNTDLADATVAAATATINGNGFVPSETNGIPMSNKQTLSVPASGSITKDLIVVRMLAKIEVQVFNDGASPVIIESISLTDVTPNTANNLKLLPNYGDTPNYPDEMDAYHKDILPNLNTTSKGNMTYTLTSDNVVATTGHKSTDDTPNPVKFNFYVNESVAPDNGSGLFYLTLGIKTGEGTTVEYSHALITQSGKTDADNDAWHYIARNDYRIIPVILTDWLFRIEPIAFVPIAGYPATLLSSDAQKATFGTGGMIALQPFVKKRTETEWRDFGDTEVTYGVEVKNGDDVDEEASWTASITWKNRDGVNKSGAGYIVLSPFTYDPVTKCIIGELNQDKVSGGTNKTAVTITLTLGPKSGNHYTYSFTCDVNI
jgi:hypothetical protein